MTKSGKINFIQYRTYKSLTKIVDFWLKRVCSSSVQLQWVEYPEQKVVKNIPKNNIFSPKNETQVNVTVVITQLRCVDTGSRLCRKQRRV